VCYLNATANELGEYHAIRGCGATRAFMIQFVTSHYSTPLVSTQKAFALPFVHDPAI